MAVHLPLGDDACREAKLLMLASGNPAQALGRRPRHRPHPGYDLGSYYLTTVRPDETGAGKVFRDEDEALMAYAEHIVTLHAPIKVRRTMMLEGEERSGLVDTTPWAASSSTLPCPRTWAMWTAPIPPTGWTTRSASGSPKRPCLTSSPAA